MASDELATLIDLWGFPWRWFWGFHFGTRRVKGELLKCLNLKGGFKQRWEQDTERLLTSLANSGLRIIEPLDRWTGLKSEKAPLTTDL
jgi:hypothetical protein